MKLYERKLLTVGECDYRVIEESGCGCQGKKIRCLLRKGKSERDVYDVQQSDCLECLCRKEVGRGKPVDSDIAVAAGNPRDEAGHTVPPGPHSGDGAAGREPVVSVKAVQSDAEQEVLRMEREVQKLWFDIRVMTNWRHPKHEQDKKNLGNSRKGGGFPPTPSGPGFPCSDGMPATIYWNPPVDTGDGVGGGYPPISLTLDPGGGSYSGSGLQYLPGNACGCTGGGPYGFPIPDVPVTVSYSPTGVHVTFFAGADGCPTNPTLDPTGSPSGFDMPPPPFTGDFFCSAGSPDDFFSDGSGPTFTPGDGSPPCKMGWPSGGEGEFYGGNRTVGDCYIPRTVFLKIYNTSDNSLVDSVTMHFAGTWGGSPSLGTHDGEQYWQGTSDFTSTEFPVGTCPSKTATVTFIMFLSTGHNVTLYVHWPFGSHVCDDTVTRNCFGFGSDSSNTADWQTWGASYACFSFTLNAGHTPSGGHIVTCGTASPYDCGTNNLYLTGNS